MKPVIYATVTAIFCGAALVQPALALEPIQEEKHINSTLLSGFIADKIADNCPTLQPRKMRALNELWKLRDYALSKGYTKDQVRALVESKPEKARGKALAVDWLKAKGAVEGKPQVYCQIGEEEIAKNSMIGYLLRSTR